MNLSVVKEADVSSGLDRRIKETLCRCFPKEAATFSMSRGWHGSMPAWSVVAEVGGQVIAHVGIVDRVIRAGQQPLRVAGVQNVCVLPECRGQGISAEIMAAAMDEAERMAFDAGLLYCLPVLERLYKGCGWLQLPKVKIVRIDESGAEKAIPSKNIAMFFPLRTQAFPPGVIHLQGNDW